jgi:tetratricopeptide (TPR) repeat protein
VANVAFFICDRFRYPVWPAMAVLAGGGVVAFVETIRRRQWARASVFAGGMALMASLSLPNWYGVKLPSFALDYRLRSIAWYEKGHFPEALSDIDRSLALNSGDMTSLQHRGNVLLALNRLEEARMMYERTLKISSEDGGVWNNYGIALDGLGRTNEALEAFRRATQCRPPSQNAFLGMAFDQIHAGRLDQAAGALDALDKQVQEPDALVLAIRSVLARKRGQPAEADRLERQAHALNPDAAAWAIKRATSAVPSPP